MSSSGEQEFAAFYDGTWRRTVACAYGMTGELSAAEDLAQEAYCQAWRRWRTVSDYDDAGAWVRLVATRLAVSRWRRLRISVDSIEWFHHHDPVGPPSEETVLLVAALKQLPEAQRRAIVLHHLGDLSVSDIARIEACQEGTVKSRLSRGRAALADLLGATAESEGEATHV